MGSIREQEEALFKEWRESLNKEGGNDKAAFVCDGVVDEDSYKASKPKIVYVLKEYAPDGEDNDLRDKLNKGVGYWWWKVAYMTYNIRRLDCPDTPSKPTHWDDDWLKEMHRSICAFNLSKVGGNAYSDMELLALQAMKRREFIQRQFDLYEPDLTICGGTFETFRYALGHDEIKTNPEKENVEQMCWYERCSGKYVVGVNHFAYPRFSYGLMDKVINEIGKFYNKK